MTVMRAARLHADGSGARLHVDHIDVPEIGADEVLIAVRACGLNRVDLLTRDGRTPAPVPLPHTSGTEVAGDIVYAGAGVDGWQPGQRVLVDPVVSCGTCAFCIAGRDNLCLRGRVYGVQTQGGYAEFALAPARQLVALPATLSYQDAAAIAVTGPTAWHMLHRRAALRAGEDVLVIAAGSGIGVLAVQIARLSGARVIATAGAQDKLDAATELGADFVVNHRDPDWPSQVRARTGGRGVDVVFEHVGAATWEGSLAAMARGGRLVTSGGHSGFDVSIDLWQLFVKEHSIIGSFAGSRRDLLDVIRLVERGQIRPVVQEIVALEGIERAHALLEERRVFGKILVDPTLPSPADAAGRQRDART